MNTHTLPKNIAIVACLALLILAILAERKQLIGLDSSKARGIPISTRVVGWDKEN